MAALISSLRQLRNFLAKRYRIRAGEILFRHCVFPFAFTSKPKFSHRKFWRLVDTGPRTIETSVAWQRLVPDEQFVHTYGCRLASKGNTALGDKATSKRRVYAGAYVVNVDDVRALVGTENLAEVATADVVHKIEAGEIAHAALLITLNPSQLDVEGTKTAIIDRLWNGSAGAVTHVCESDKQLSPHPSLLLPAGPRGPYVDARRTLIKQWHKARFCVDKRILEVPDDAR